MSGLKPSWALPGLLAAMVATTVVTVGHPAMAQTTEEMIATAEKACLDAAVTQGYDPIKSEIISSESVDADTVKVVLNVTSDGENFARLTCPYSVSRGLATLDDLKDAATGMVDGIATPGWSRLWWLLLPIIGLPLLLWWVRGRQPEATGTIYRDYTEGYVNAYGNALNVHERPDGLSAVLRTLRDGTLVHLTGRRSNEWLELRDGGWVDGRALRFTDDTPGRRYA